MANTITKTEILDGERVYILHTTILGDGSGEESATSLIDVSAIAGAPSEVVIEKVWAGLSGFSCSLLWDATADVTAVNIPDAQPVEYDFTDFAGLPNTSGAGKSGDLLFTTVGLGSGDAGHITLRCRKK